MEGGATPAVAGVTGLVGGVRLLLGAIGLISTISGLINDSVVAALNTAGVIGLPALVICGWPVLAMLFGGQHSNHDPESSFKTALITSLVVTAIAAVAFLAGRPMDENELQFGLLTIMGIAVTLMFAVLASAGWKYALKGRQPPQKTCPDCANTVLTAARKCQYCGYRFN
jgi:hypothetical protein